MNVRTVTGSLAALNDVVTTDVSDMDEVSFFLSAPSSTLTVTFEVSVDGSTWTSMGCVDYSSTSTTTAITSIAVAAATISSNVYARNVVTARQVRCRISAFTGGGPVAITTIAGRLGRG